MDDEGVVKEFVVLIPIGLGGYACIATFDSDCEDDAKTCAREYKRSVVAQVFWEHTNGREIQVEGWGE